MLESPGIPIWIGQNRSQPVFASWYNDIDYDYSKGVRKGEELKASRYINAAVTRNYIIIYNIIPDTSNSSFIVAIYIQIPLN